MNRRWVIGGCSAVIVLAAALQLTRTPGAISGVAQLQGTSSSESRSPAYPPAMGGPDIVERLVTAAESRRKIVDSADLYATVSEITVRSPTIDKIAAAEVLMACADFRPKGKREPEQQAAAQELGARCAGIRYHMRRNGAIDRAVELRAAAENDTSALGRLAALSRRSDAGNVRWHAAELTLVSEALRSSDLVILSEGLRALHAQLDDSLPDSKLRSQAFARAVDLYAAFGGDRRTVFDALVECANLGRCVNEPSGAQIEHDSAPGGIRERSEVGRLVEHYRLALQRGATPAELLAVR